MNSALIRGVTWNLLLAAIPVVLAYLLAWAMTSRKSKANLPIFITIPLALVWLIFVPNTCYLLTEWRHLLFDKHWADLLQSGNSDKGAMLATAKWAVLFLGYSGIGVLLFVLSVRPVERAIRSSKRNPLLYALPFFFLVSLGVYLGLSERLNSWDVIRHPRAVWTTMQDVLTSPTLLGTVAVFALILYLMYEAVDLWVDGVVARLKR